MNYQYTLFRSHLKASKPIFEVFQTFIMLFERIKRQLANIEKPTVRSLREPANHSNHLFIYSMLLRNT